MFHIKIKTKETLKINQNRIKNNPLKFMILFKYLNQQFKPVLQLDNSQILIFR